jgi:hypothetical protein
MLSNWSLYLNMTSCSPLFLDFFLIVERDSGLHLGEPYNFENSSNQNILLADILQAERFTVHQPMSVSFANK